MSRPQGPVDHAVDGIEDPEPADAAERDRRDPGKQDQEPQQPLAAEISQQRHRQHVREYQDENLGDEREHDGILDRDPERLAAHHAPEIFQADEMHLAARHSCIRQAVIEREQERKADEEHDVENRRRKHEPPQPAFAIGHPAEPSGHLAVDRGCDNWASHHAPAPFLRRPVARSKRTMSLRRTMKSYLSPPAISVRMLVGILEITWVSGCHPSSTP